MSIQARRGLNEWCAAADDRGMSSRCRYCGDPVELSADDACPRCGASADCDRCGHPRASHVGSFRDGRGCAHVWVERPATLATGCECAGFAPAGVGAVDEELRLVVGALHAHTPVPSVPGR